ncbi:flavin monoamine oxidase family protein [Synechocystis sp. PCC 7509]|uniref:flavin monoamine oxidase family protein n=1 Tax=Synechocystis sp. PCC 7509 TaxID=927677 RepID=UPI0002AC470F|nr:NAD(P)/FAD-dependent oxidoreductase [Synechocystis sp. PCC 7509]
MDKSKLISSLRKAYNIAHFSIKSGIPTDEIIDTLATKTTRRRFVYGGLAVASAVSTASFNYRLNAKSINTSKMLIVGGGIAGLTAGYRLQQAGVPVDIIEATNRLGGRIRTTFKALGTSIPAEMGGEFIDSGHENLLGLAKELGLKVVDLQTSDKGLETEVWYFENRKITQKEIIDWFVPLAQKIDQDLAAIGEGDINYRVASPKARKFDRLSITEYLETAAIEPILKQMLALAYTTEYGREASEQSCLNLLFLIGTDTDKFQLYGESDERYQIAGGNEQIIQRLVKLLTNSIQTQTVLESISTLSDGRYQVSLRNGLKTFSRTYERILLTLPFTALRQVATSKVTLPPIKRKVIAQLGYGKNAKLITSYSQRLWRDKYQSSAAIFTDLEFQSTWESSRYVTGSQGLITNFTGGKYSASLNTISPESQAQKLVNQLDKVFPAISDVRQASQAIRAYWLGERYFQGSYSCYLVGQWTSIAGAEKERVGNIFFAGEHCSGETQGYMEGGCASGEEAAKEILLDLGLKV